MNPIEVQTVFQFVQDNPFDSIIRFCFFGTCTSKSQQRSHGSIEQHLCPWTLTNSKNGAWTKARHATLCKIGTKCSVMPSRNLGFQAVSCKMHVSCQVSNGRQDIKKDSRGECVEHHLERRKPTMIW